ncbi:hypothetical protein ERHA55_30360 [Erwinia rhapontici]|nr:hypothetical protein ERHA55_30360 [Erwinia rhapontici]
MLRIYAPCKAEELARVVRPQGYVLTVTPGPRHLMQFKALIYQDVQLHDTTPEEMPGFTLVEEQQLSYPMTLNSEESGALLQMTPFAWRARPEVWEFLPPPNSSPVRQISPCVCGSATALLSSRWMLATLQHNLINLLQIVELTHMDQ